MGDLDNQATVQTTEGTAGSQPQEQDIDLSALGAILDGDNAEGGANEVVDGEGGGDNGAQPDDKPATEEQGDDKDDLDALFPDDAEGGDTPFLDARVEVEGKPTGTVYKTAEEAVKGIIAKDQFINRLREENASLKEALQKPAVLPDMAALLSDEKLLPLVEQEVLETLQKEFPDDDIEQDSVRTIAARVAKKLRESVLPTDAKPAQEQGEANPTTADGPSPEFLAKIESPFMQAIKDNPDLFVEPEDVKFILGTNLTKHPDYQKALNTKALFDRSVQFQDFDVALRTVLPIERLVPQKGEQLTDDEIERRAAEIVKKRTAQTQARTKNVPGTQRVVAEQVQKVDPNTLTGKELDEYNRNAFVEALNG